MCSLSLLLAHSSTGSLHGRPLLLVPVQMSLPQGSLSWLICLSRFPSSVIFHLPSSTFSIYSQHWSQILWMHHPNSYARWRIIRFCQQEALAGSWRAKGEREIGLLSPSSPFWIGVLTLGASLHNERSCQITFSPWLQLSLDYDNTISSPWSLMRAFCCYQSLAASTSLVASFNAAYTSVSSLFISISSVNHLNGNLFFF